MISTAESQPARAQSRRLEILALLLLTVGSVALPIVGWIAGVVLMWASSVWTTRDKLIGSLFVPGGLLPAFFLMVSVGQTCSEVLDSSGAVVESTCSGTGAREVAWIAVFGLLILLPIAAWIYLAVRLRRLAA